jgi:hypothetical protein
VIQIAEAVPCFSIVSTDLAMTSAAIAATVQRVVS